MRWEPYDFALVAQLAPRGMKYFAVAGTAEAALALSGGTSSMTL
jgi:hypothetical protein